MSKNTTTNTERSVGEPEEAIFKWRADQLEKSGFPREVAERIARDRSIDIHKAHSIITACGPELAAEILL